MTLALQDAKNRFSAVADEAYRGSPQVVTRRGRPLVAIISYDLYREKICPSPRKNIAEAFRDCPVDVDFRVLIPPRSARSGRAHPAAALFAHGDVP